MLKKRILVVDDQEDLLDAMRRVLAVWGYDVITASSGKEALRILKKAEKFIDIVILDIMMPNIDGIETLRRIRRFNKEIPVIMLTGYPSDERLAKTKKLGISGFITKGEEFIESARVIRKALGQTKETSRKK